MSKYRQKERWFRLNNTLIVFAMAFAPIVLMIPFFLLLDVAGRIGPWWILLLAVYLVLINWPPAYVMQMREQLQMRFLIGDEKFYEFYPKALKKALKRARKDQPYERIQQVVYYRQRLEAIDRTEQEIEYGERRRLHDVLYSMAAAIIFALVVYGLYGVFTEWQNGIKLNLIWAVRLLSLSMMVLTGMVTARKIRFKLPGAIAAVLLLVKLWSDIVNLLQKPATYTVAPIIESAVILAVFLIAAFGVTGIANRVSDDVRTRREKKEFDLAMYELGVIDEKELAYRMGK